MIVKKKIELMHINSLILQSSMGTRTLLKLGDYVLYTGPFFNGNEQMRSVYGIWGSFLKGVFCVGCVGFFASIGIGPMILDLLQL